MVVDALRSDFVYGNQSQFHFTQGLIRSGAAIPFTGHASPPTITMPRVKSITTGSVPSFLDLVLSFDESDTSATLASQDSWLAQLRRARPESHLVMYGDDTWLRLFPGFFGRADGTTSFFVSDFTEVDSNVTRHVPDELMNDDWSGMILHYLGLDHIGHKTGPRGPNMPSKQKEMDGIVQQIYEAIVEQPHLESCVLVLLGDHGMNEAGNHGANSAGEVSTALTFISPKFKQLRHHVQCPASYSDDFTYYTRVDQSDLAPTLAALLGFPVPRNNLGVLIPRLLGLWNSEMDRTMLLTENAVQIGQIARATYPSAFETFRNVGDCRTDRSVTDQEHLACLWHFALSPQTDVVQQDECVDDFSSRTTHVLRFLAEAQSMLSGTASQYDLPKMYVGAGLALMSVMLSVILTSSSIVSNTFGGFVFTLAIILYGITMFASSYVEEEHQFWYWISSAWMLVLSIKARRYQGQYERDMTGVGAFGSFVLFGIVRRWNQTGQKYAGEFDLATGILQHHPWTLWILVFLTYLTVSRRLRSRPVTMGTQRLSLLSVCVAASALLFKLSFTAADAPELLDSVHIPEPALKFAQKYSLVSLARVVFIGLGNLLAAAVYYEKPWTSRQHLASFLQTVHDISSLFLLTQTRTSNIPLVLLSHAQVQLLTRSRLLHPFDLLLTMLFMQYASFFAFGGTNAISSIDLSNAYNGVGGFNVLAVGMLTFISNWIGPIWWASATACVLSRHSIPNQAGVRHDFDYYGLLSVFMSTSTFATMVACTMLREHLFIWTVFSPKYLYMMAWTFGHHMVINSIFGSIITVSG